MHICVAQTNTDEKKQIFLKKTVKNSQIHFDEDDVQYLFGIHFVQTLLIALNFVRFVNKQR
jgi:hypothetical protein